MDNIRFKLIKAYIEEKGEDVSTMLQKLNIVWIDTSFDPNSDFYDEGPDEYITELDGYNFATCRKFYDIDAGVKHLATRTCKNIILISGGFICCEEMNPNLI
jgi:hypothetical protein